MKLIHNWKAVALHSHSMWAFYLSLIALLTPDVVFYVWGVDTNPRLWFVLGVGLLIYGIAGRLKDQGLPK
jgi:hypothetical protein